MTLSVAILDWGRAASIVKMADSERDLAKFDVQKAKKEFDRSVIVQVEQFGLLKDQLMTAKEADRVAENGYKIALKRFETVRLALPTSTSHLQSVKQQNVIISDPS